MREDKPMTSKNEQLLKAIIACIQADRKVTEQERAFFEDVLERLDVEDKDKARGWLKEPQSLNPRQLCLAFQDRTERADVLKTVLGVAMVDGQLKLAEVTFLGDLMDAMEMHFEELDAIEPDSLSG